MVYNVCYATDDNYIVQAAVSISSLLYNNKNHKFNIYILDNNISKQNRDKLAGYVREQGQGIEFCDVSKRLNSLIENNINSYGGYGSYAAYARIFIKELLPIGINKVLYIDCDTVINGDIRQLYEFDLGGRTLGAVRDITNSGYNITIGLAYDDVYYNSGVLLIDLDKWGEKNYLNKILHHITAVRAQYQNVDQDIINIVAKGDICTLDPKYNHIIPIDTLGWKHLCYMLDKTEETYYGKEVSREAACCPIIIHYTYFFTGRPWFKNAINGDADKLWDKYLYLTPWNSYVKKNQSFSFAEKCQRLVLGHRILPSIFATVIFKILFKIRLKYTQLRG